MLISVAVGGLAVGALVEYFLDPGAGRRRRHMARDRALSRMRRGERPALVRARRAESHAIGVARRIINARRQAEEPLDDVTLAQKVERQLFRLTGVPKGQVKQEGIEHMGEEARRIEGARGREPGPFARHAGAAQPLKARTATGRGVRLP